MTQKATIKMSDKLQTFIGDNGFKVTKVGERITAETKSKMTGGGELHIVNGDISVIIRQNIKKPDPVSLNGHPHKAAIIEHMKQAREHMMKARTLAINYKKENEAQS